MDAIKETLKADLNYAIDNLERLVEMGEATTEEISGYVEHLKYLITTV